MGPIQAHDLMYESIRLYSNDHQSYKVKWYQTGLFKVFTVVIAVAVAISLFGLSSGATLATVVGVLVEVPVMLLLVRFANSLQDKFEN